jgi:hypothetical protein
MLFLAQSLLRAAGFEYDEIEETWVARTPLKAWAAVECDEDQDYIREALREVRAIFDAHGWAYQRLAISAGFVSLAGASISAA